MSKSALESNAQKIAKVITAMTFKELTAFAIEIDERRRGFDENGTVLPENKNDLLADDVLAWAENEIEN
jgi:hypothetical protein